jgi:hypothetical protein
MRVLNKTLPLPLPLPGVRPAPFPAALFYPLVQEPGPLCPERLHAEDQGRERQRPPTGNPFFFPCLLLRSLFSLSFCLFVVFGLCGGGGRRGASFRLVRGGVGAPAGGAGPLPPPPHCLPAIAPLPALEKKEAKRMIRPETK